MKPMELKKLEVQCDEIGCNWSKEVDFKSLPEWHQKVCPVCFEGVIINDADLETIKGLEKVYAAVKDFDIPGDTPLFDITINTAGLRSK